MTSRQTFQGGSYYEEHTEDYTAIGDHVFLFPVTAGQVLAGGINYFPEISVEIISDERGYLNKYAAEYGDMHARRNYVVARDDERYRIRVHNRSNERIGLVIAVDGRNIISGRKSYFGPNERMYILGPYDTGEYEGWRTGKNRVNRFYFTGMSDSYAASWGDYSAMGVIAMAAYKSRHRGIYWKKGSKETDRWKGREQTAEDRIREQDSVKPSGHQV